jgi:hypothetical protein
MTLNSMSLNDLRLLVAVAPVIALSDFEADAVEQILPTALLDE